MTTLNRSARTAVFVRRSANDSSSYRNRVEGLFGSLNREPDYADGGTINADFYVVDDAAGTVTPGIEAPAPKPVVSPYTLEAVRAAGYTVIAPASQGTGGRLSSPYLRRLARDAGYTVSVVVDS